VLVVYVGVVEVEGCAVGLGLPEAGAGGRFGGGLQDSNGLVIAKDFDGGALLDELEVVVEVVAKLGEGAVVGHRSLSLWFLGSLKSSFHACSSNTNQA
jgi:hypothetical protein